jgi:hypothetical protein
MRKFTWYEGEDDGGEDSKPQHRGYQPSVFVEHAATQRAGPDEEKDGT